MGLPEFWKQKGAERSGVLPPPVPYGDHSGVRVQPPAAPGKARLDQRVVTCQACPSPPSATRKVRAATAACRTFGLFSAREWNTPRAGPTPLCEGGPCSLAGALQPSGCLSRTPIANCRGGGRRLRVRIRARASATTLRWPRMGGPMATARIPISARAWTGPGASRTLPPPPLGAVGSSPPV